MLLDYLLLKWISNACTELVKNSQVHLTVYKDITFCLCILLATNYNNLENTKEVSKQQENLKTFTIWLTGSQ